MPRVVPRAEALARTSIMPTSYERNRRADDRSSRRLADKGKIARAMKHVPDEDTGGIELTRPRKAQPPFSKVRDHGLTPEVKKNVTA